MLRRLWFLPFLVTAWAWAGDTAQVRVLFTSDMHARVLPFDQVRQRPARGSVAQVATVIAKARAQWPASVVLDGGDDIEGTPLAHYAHFGGGADGVDPTIQAMNLIGYDAAVVGNHEFNYGLAVLRGCLKQSHFPWLAANLQGAKAADLPLGDTVVLERSGVRIGVLGLTNPNIPHWDPPAHWAGLQFLDPVATAAAQVAELRRRADVVVVVVHAGFERDLETGAPNDSDYENFAWRLAALPGIDLLLTGHTHRDIQPRKVGSTVVAQPGRWAEEVTRIDLTLKRQKGHWVVADWQGANLPTAGETPDERIVRATEPLRARVEQELSRVIGELQAPLRVGGLPTADDAGLDLIHAVQLEATGAQLSLAAPLGMASLEFPAGKVTPRLAFALYPYPNTLMVVALTGKQLSDVLEHAARGWIGLDCGKPDACTLLRDPELPPYNFDSLQGASYLVNPLAPVGGRIRGLRMATGEVGPDQIVTLAINSYRGAGGGNYPHLTTATRVLEVDRPMTDLLIEYLERHGKVTPKADDNWALTIPVREAPAREPGASPR